MQDSIPFQDSIFFFYNYNILILIKINNGKKLHF